MTVLEVKDKTFSRDKFKDYHLVIKPGGNFFYAAFYDLSAKKLIYFLKSDEFDLEKFLAENGNVKKAHLLVDTRRNTVLPLSYFDEDKTHVLFDFVFGAGESDKANLQYDRLLFDSIVNVYDAEFYVQGNVNIVSEFSVYCDVAVSTYKSGSRKPLIYIVLRDGFFYLYVVDENKLQIANALIFKSINDVLYHLFNVIDKYSLAKDEVEVYLVPGRDKIFANSLVEKAKEGGVKVFVMNEVQKTFLSYKLNTVDTADLYDFYTFLIIENNRR